ncbi:hypothetical protein QUB72_13310 [Enterococcus faecium]|nr:hypothetical protein [Enterococcus faecium]
MGTLTIDTLGKVLNVAVDKDTVDRISDSLNEIIYNLKEEIFLLQIPIHQQFPQLQK